MTVRFKDSVLQLPADSAAPALGSPCLVRLPLAGGEVAIAMGGVGLVGTADGGLHGVLVARAQLVGHNPLVGDAVVDERVGVGPPIDQIILGANAQVHRHLVVGADRVADRRRIDAAA